MRGNRLLLGGLECTNVWWKIPTCFLPENGVVRLLLNMRSRLIFIFVGLVAALAASLLLLPWWLEPVLRRVGAPWGGSFGTYERIGYTRFVLRNVEVRQPGWRIAVSRIEANTPALWLWRRWNGRASEIVVDNWVVGAERRDSHNPGLVANQINGWISLQARLLRVVTELDRWLLQAELGRGRVSWPGGVLTLQSATWKERTLNVSNAGMGPLKMSGSIASPVGSAALQLTARMLDANGTVTLESHGAHLTAHTTWLEQKADLTAHFGAEGWWPSEASFQTDDWSLPGAQLNLGDHYATVRGQGKIAWHDGHSVAEVTLKGEPLAGKSAPALEATLRGHGDVATFTIEVVHATLPGITAELSEPVTVNHKGEFQSGAARFLVQADLAKQPWCTAQGTIRGEAELVSGGAHSPIVVFNFSARDVMAGTVALSAASVQGRFEWPRLAITAGKLTMAEGETLEGRGGWDFQKQKIIDATVTGQIRRGTLVRWLPSLPDFAVGTVKAQVSGPLHHLLHSGSVQATEVKWPGLSPLALASTWRGQGDQIDDFTAEAKAGLTAITATGGANRAELHLSSLVLTQRGMVRLALEKPASIQWSPALRIEAFDLAGEGGARVAITLGETGRGKFALRAIASTWCEDFVRRSIPSGQVNSFTVEGEWAHGPMTFTANSDVSVDLGDQRKARIELNAKGNEAGLQVEVLRATEGTTTIFTATGRAPIVLFPRAAPLLRIEAAGDLAIDAATESNGMFWEEFAKLTGMEFKEPQVTAHVTGTWTKPLGTVRVQAARIALDPQRFKRPWPVMASLDLALTGNRDAIKLETFTVSVEGHPIRAEGSLKVGAGGWDELSQQPLAYIQHKAELHLMLPEIELSAFADFLPAYLAPKGRVEAELNYGDGGALKGFLRLHDAASRPLGPLGMLQEMNADLEFTGRHAELRRVTAIMGGQPVTVSGTIDYPATAALHYALALRGENLPFIRQTGLLVRGDLDLHLRTPGAGATVLEGTVRLHDSLILSDVRALYAGGPKGSARPPPYFSVEQPPLSAWALRVDVSGDHFMRLRTPFFNGVASANFHLGGTLGEPRAIGEVVIEEGQVLLPFASFVVKQGTARITEASPHELALFVRGTGHRYNYELNLEITGTAEKPNVVFSSSPSLDTEPLLLMVMTGEAPSTENIYSGKQKFARLGVYLGQSLLGRFGGDATSADRLSITAGEQVSRQGRETYDVEYKLADRWKMVGEYDEFDDFNFGLKWRLYPGKTPTGGTQK